MKRSLVAFAFGFAVLVAVGCDSKSSAPTQTPPPTGVADTGPKPAGRVVFDQKCANCHSINGSAVTGKMGGPDLSHIGANQTQEWILAHVRDPKTHKPQSRMPAYGEDKLNAADAKTLGEYLAGLK